MPLSAREVINARARVVMALTYAGLGIFLIAALVAALGGPPPYPVAFAGAILMASGFYLNQIVIRCPRCKGGLTELVTKRLSLRIDPRVRFCPYCGVGLDDENSLHQSC